MSKIKNMKKSFTLIEVLIGVALFFIITIFLYKTLDIGETSNNFYNDKLDKFESKNNINITLYEDFLNLQKDTNTTMTEDKNKNTILKLKSKNTFHNPFFTNITYFVGKNSELVRVESKEIFDENQIENVLKNSYIDVLTNQTKVFKVINKTLKDGNNTKDGKFAVYLEFLDGEKLYLTTGDLN